MPHIDDFWDDIVDEGLVDPDQAGRARARFIQVGGGLDTAVLENARLDPEARQTLLEIAARALGRKLAAPVALAEPDREAARHIPRTIIDRYGVMPARDDKGRLILITPPLAPHVFNEFKARLGRSFDARLALEIDIRLAIARHLDVPLPSRFDALRSGRRPQRGALSGVPARRPSPRPPDVSAFNPTPAPAASPPAPSTPSGQQSRSWLSEASTRLRKARGREALFELLAEAGSGALSGRFYLLATGPDRIRCVAGTGLAKGAGPSIALHRDSRLDHALRIGSSRLEDWSHDPDLTALYTALGRSRPARIMIEPIRDGLEVVGVFVGDHGRAGIDRGVVGTLRRWLSRVSVRLADLRDSRAPGPQPPPVVEPPAPPPRVAPPPAAAPAGLPPADPFAPPGPRRRPRRRGALDLQELAEAARTAQATADALPAAESQEFVLPAPAPSERPPAARPPLEDDPPPADPSLDETSAPPPAPPAETTSAPPPAAPEPPPPEPPPPPSPAPEAPADVGLPFSVDDEDPLADFLSDPELEAVAEAIAAREPPPGAAPEGEPLLDDMGRPPNTLPSRPRSMPRAPAPAGSVFEAVIPRTDGAPPDGGTPAATRPARPEAFEDGPPPAAGDASPPQVAGRSPERPGPTVNLRGPEAEAERRKRPTADLGPRPADISVDELIEEARSLGQTTARAAIADRSTVDLRGELDGAPPDDEAARGRKTVNLRRAPGAPPPSGEVLELDDADVLEVADEPETVDVSDADVVEVLDVEAAGPAPFDRRALEEAETGVFTTLSPHAAAEAPQALPDPPLDEAPSAPPPDDATEPTAAPEASPPVSAPDAALSDAALSDAALSDEARRALGEAETGVFSLLDPEDIAGSPLRIPSPPVAAADAPVHPEAETVELPEASGVPDPTVPSTWPALPDRPATPALPEVAQSAAPDAADPEPGGGGSTPRAEDPDDANEGSTADPAVPGDAEADSTADPAVPEHPDGGASPPVAEPEPREGASTPRPAAREQVSSAPAAVVERPDAPRADRVADPEAPDDDSTAREVDPEGGDDDSAAREVDPEGGDDDSTAHEADSEAPDDDSAAREVDPDEAPDDDSTAREADPAAPDDDSAAREADPEAPDDDSTAREADPEVGDGAATSRDADPEGGEGTANSREADPEVGDGAATSRDADPEVGDGAATSREADPEVGDDDSTPREADPEAPEDDSPARADAPEGGPDAPAQPEPDAAPVAAGPASTPPAGPPPASTPPAARAPRNVTPSEPAIALDDLLDDSIDDGDDDLSDLRLSPPPAPQPSPTFEAIDALDLTGEDDSGIDLDLDLGLDLGLDAPDLEPPLSDGPVAAGPPEPADPAVASPAPDAAKLTEAVAALMSADQATVATAEGALVAGGAAALEPLFAVFPGPLLVDRYATGDTVPVDRHGPVLRTICRIGPPAGPYLAQRCEHLAPDVRYYAVFAFSAVRDPASVASIAPALTDKDPTVRAVACRVADTYRGDEIFGVLVTHLVSIVEKGRLADRRLAAEALGVLHTADGARPLIAMLNAPQPPLRDAAHKALVEIARQDFGVDVWRWRTFFERSAARPRVEWLLDGLLSDQRNIRVGAFNELRRLTRQNYGYTPDAPPTARRAAAERWVGWWHQAGRARFGHYR